MPDAVLVFVAAALEGRLVFLRLAFAVLLAVAADRELFRIVFAANLHIRSGMLRVDMAQFRLTGRRVVLPGARDFPLRLLGGFFEHSRQLRLGNRPRLYGVDQPGARGLLQVEESFNHTSQPLPRLKEKRLK